MLKIRAMGYPEVTIDGTLIEKFLSNKVTVLLCYLAFNPHTHARERLAGLFWGDMPDSNAKSNLRQALHDLNKRVGPYVEVTRQTVRFRDDLPYQVDALDLKQVAANITANHDKLAELVEMYRGMFLEGVNIDVEGELEDWLRTEEEQLRLYYIDVLDYLGKEQMQQAAWPDAENTLRKLIAIEPLREATHRQLMTSYARQGQYSLALNQYESCARILDEELAVEPSPDTVKLYEQIQLARRIRRHNLPTAVGAFVGREAELKELGDWLRDPSVRFINILGPGGIGKSRLAHHLALLHTDSFLHGVRYLSLVPFTQATQFAGALAEELDLSLSGAAAPIEQVQAYLQDKEMLLVMDNAEHLPNLGQPIDAILRAAPDIKIIMTSRRGFNLQQEHLYRLGGLATPEISASDSDAGMDSDSIQLYIHNAQQHLRGFSSDGHEQAISRFCQLVGGMPLAIEIATALLPVISCEQLTREIATDLDLLDTPVQNIPERHRSLRAVFDHSWRLLLEKEQITLARLSVFRGPFSLDAARAITEASLPTLHKLVAQSLLHIYPDETETRYNIHITVRQYALEMLDKSAFDAVLNKHVDFYSALLEDHDRVLLKSKKRAESLAQSLNLTGRELSNIRMAWEYALDRQHFDALIRMSAPLHRFYEGSNRFQEGGEIFDFALESLNRADLSQDAQAALSKVAIHCAGIHLRLGNIERVLELAQSSVPVFEAQQQHEDLGFALNVLGIAQLYTGQYDAARDTLLQCADLYRRIDKPAELLKPLANLGSLSVRTGQHELAKSVLFEGVEISERLGDQRGLSHFLANLGAVHQSTGDYETALQYFERVLLLSDALSNLHVKGVTLMNMGEMQVRRGDYIEAQDALRDCMAIMREINDMRNLAAAHMWIGLAHSGLNNPVQSADSLYQGLEIARQTEATPTILNVLVGVGHFFLDNRRDKRGAAILRCVLDQDTLEHGFREFAQQALDSSGADGDNHPMRDAGLDAITIECLTELKAIAGESS